jgi:Family of unknown function (DUF6804)
MLFVERIDSHTNVNYIRSDAVKRILLPQLIVSGMLVCALNPDNAHGYYVLLRWVCCVMFGYLALQAYAYKQQDWFWVLGLTAAVYNPLVPLHLTREIWSVVNLLTIGIALVSIFALQLRDNAGRQAN